jgi:hypothetical protein
MAEIKNNFSQGKMNKDLDERLIPNGQYRDAMNIKVSTSDDSDVGTVQNILGNVNFSQILDNNFINTLRDAHKLTYRPFCVGTVHDEKNNQVYWFVNFYLTPIGDLKNDEIYSNYNLSNLSLFDISKIQKLLFSRHKESINNMLYPGNNLTVLQDNHNLSVIPVSSEKDAILFLDNLLIQDVFNNGKENLIDLLKLEQTTVDTTNYNFLVSERLRSLISKKISCIFRLNQDEKFKSQKIKGLGINVDDSYPIVGLKDSIDIVFIDHNNTLGLFPNVFNNNAVNHDDTYKYVTKVASIFDGRRDFAIVQTDNKIITGINIIDDMLFFTNNLSEPKKINIPKSIIGSQARYNTTGRRRNTINYNVVNVNSSRTTSSIFNPTNHTKLVDIRKNEFITYGTEVPGELPVYVREDHITVIKKSPKYPPVLEMRKDTVLDDDGVRKRFIGGTFNNFTDNNNTTTDFTFDNVVQNSIIKINLAHPDLAAAQSQGLALSDSFSLARNDQVVIEPYTTSSPPSFPLKEFLVKGVIETIDATGTRFANGWRISIRITAISSETPLGLDVDGSPFNFALSLFVDQEKLFRFKFPRFSYRYKYIDGEYSCFAPFSEIAFLPGNFDYHPRKGFNLGMINQLDKLYIKEFVTEDMPEDVESIDLLYKETGSNNVYILDTLRNEDTLIDKAPYNGRYNEYNYVNTVKLNAAASFYNNLSLPPSGLFFNKKRNGYYEVKSETIYSLVSSNQLLRPFDNVPIRAYSQEITANRLIYGNYIQNYDLLNYGYNALIPEGRFFGSIIGPVGVPGGTTIGVAE